LALKLLEQAAAQPPQHPLFPGLPNIGVAAAEHALGLRYAQGVGVHKNLPTAAYWYQRAVDHGSAQSANNLALMYQQGAGVDRNLDKAEKLFQVSARGGDPNAMLSLAQFLLYKNDLQMAKAWYDRACESGNIVAQMKRDMFEKALGAKKDFIDSCPPQMINAMKNVLDSLKTKGSVYKKSDQPYIYIYNYSVLNEHANRGSITAKKMCNALEHFMEALNILVQSETLTEKQEDLFVHELSQCYHIEHIVAQIPGIEMYRKIGDIVDRVLRRCSLESNVVDSQLDEDARLCYVLLHMDSHKLVLQFLDPCKQKYPKSIYFFEFSAAVNGWLKKYEATLYDANIGLEIDSNTVSYYMIKLLHCVY
jgi:hypothetical protein